MKKKMYEIHEEVFQLLMDYHKKDENFLFTLRQINRSNKLNKGYWFLGNDDYLAVSFWRGTDRLAKTPRIFFQIYKDGRTSLELRNEDVFGHIDFFHYKLLSQLGIKENSSTISKRLSENDYLKSLKSFIQNEKVIIDNFVRNNKLNSTSATEWSEPIDFIYPGDFNNQLIKIEEYRRRRKNQIKNSGFIKSIKILDFGPIKNVSLTNISLDCKWLFLTGENGAGKTSLLKAIATGICRNNDMNEPIAEEKTYGKFKINLSMHDKKHSSRNFEIKYDNFEEQNWATKPFAAYGPVRLLTEGTLDSNLFNPENNIHKKASYGLFNPIGVLRDLSNYSLFTKPKNLGLTEEWVIENLENIIPNIAYIKKDNEVLKFYESRDGQILTNGITFDQLPSGTRNFTALILDLLIRFQNQQPKISDPAEYNGIVLIDEIDIHLHPKLQLDLVNQLSETFPNIQFIVSTHSPVTLLAAPKNSMVFNVKFSSERGVYINRLDDKIYLEELLPNTLLTSPIFGVEDIFPNEFKGTKPPRIEDNYDEIKLNDLIDEKISDFLSDSKEQELIERIKNKRKS